jgi:Putative peptidoglycan binding domain
VCYSANLSFDRIKRYFACYAFVLIILLPNNRSFIMKQYLKTFSLLALTLAFIIPAGEVFALPTYEDACQTPLISSSLTVGFKNQDVRDLQEFLVQRNLLSESSVSGYYGPLTRQAVREFQASNGIVSSGTAATTGYGAVGSRTRAAINTIACGDVGGTTGGGTTTTIPQGPNLNPGAPDVSVSVLPTVTLSVGQSSVPYERSTSLTWSSTNATRCTPGGAWTWPGTMPVSGSLFSTGALTAPINSFSITCFNSAGQSATDTKIVSVTNGTTTTTPSNSTLTVSLKANGSSSPSPIAVGAPVLLEWSISAPGTAISTCTGSGSGIGSNGIDAALWNGGKTPLGSMTARPLVTTTYTLQCTSGGQTASASVTVPVITGSTGSPSTGTGPTITSFTATPGVVAGVGVGMSQMWTFSWSAINSAYCYGTDGQSPWASQRPTSGSVTINVFGDQLFTLKCTSGSGLFAPTDTRSISIVMDRSVQPGPAVTFTASSNTATVNSPFTLTWSAPTATSCTGGGDGSFSLFVSGTSGSKAIAFYSPGTYTMSITCKSANNGFTTRTQTVVVAVGGQSGTNPTNPTNPTGANALGIDIEANGSDGPVTVPAGQPLTIKWGMSNNALIFRTVCVVSGDSNFTGNRNPVGSFTVTASQSTTYTISCQDNGQGPVSSDSVSVIVGAANTAPSAVLSASSASVTSGGATTLTWSATNANVCLLTGGNLNVTNNSVQGTVSTGPLTQSTTYSLSCYKNVPNSNNYLVPVYAPTQTVTVSVVPTGGTGTGGTGTGGATNGSDVTLDVRANNSKGSITTSASSAAANISWQLNSSNSTAFIGWTCTASGVPGISAVGTGGQTLFVRPTVTTTYGVSCTSFLTGQTVSDAVTVIVQ